MGKLLPNISDKEAAFIASQKVFFVATAPLSKDHHVSVSPKSPGNSCVVLDPYTVAYADLTGSGAETAAHVLQNERMTIMFCNAEQGPPKILRLFGKAELILAENVSLELKQLFPKSIIENPGFRAVYMLHVERVSSSCGYTLPIMSFEKYRKTGEEWSYKKGRQGVFDYATEKNSFSIDGLPSLALLRKNNPPGIQPVAEEGYILGKSGGNDSETNIRSAMELARQMNQNRKGRLDSVGKMFMLLLLSFLLGVACGQHFGASVGPLDPETEL